jgi:hypothetical protein
MVSQILPLLSRLIPTGIAVKGLEKINPKISSFLGGAFGAGYTADQAIDFLREHLESPDNKGIKARMEQGSAAGTLRPDELAAQKRIRETEEIPNALKSLALGGSALAGGMAASRGMNKPEMSAPQQMPQSPAPPQSAREQSLKRHSEMNKRKKLIDQLTEDFENEYGQGNVSATRFPGASEGASPNERIQQGTPGQSQNLERLIQLLQQRKQRGL